MTIDMRSPDWKISPEREREQEHDFSELRWFRYNTRKHKTPASLGKISRVGGAFERVLKELGRLLDDILR